MPANSREWSDVEIDLSPWLDDRCGQFIVSVEPKGRMPKEKRRRLTDFCWVQVTRLGLDSVMDATTLWAWVTDLEAGAPLSGATVTLGTSSAVSGEDGTCALPLADEPESVVTARLNRDLALLPEESQWRLRRGGLTPRTACLMFDDRGVYRPGECVRVKGWLRTLTAGPTGDVAPAPDGVGSVGWTARDAQHNEIASGSASVDNLGGFDIAVDLPDTVDLGEAWVELDLPGAGSRNHHRHHRFQIAEFRRPEYEVSVCIDQDRVISGHRVTAWARAAHYAGGPLRSAPVDWKVTATPARLGPFHVRRPGTLVVGLLDR